MKIKHSITFILIFIGAVFISSVSQVLLKSSANHKHENILKEYLNFRVTAAYAMFFSATLITVFAYKEVPLSLGPVLESFGYIFVAVLSRVFLEESLSKKQFVGILLIFAGILIVSFEGLT